MKLEPGIWILVEGMMLGLLGRPRVVTKVSGKRVYWTLRTYNKDGSLDVEKHGFSMEQSVKWVVPTEAAGNEIYAEQRALETAREHRIAAANQKFYNDRAQFAKIRGATPYEGS